VGAGTVGGGRLREGDAVEVVLDELLEELVHLVGDEVDPLRGGGGTEPEWL
jgi:hypothetical protein